ncbi:MAG: hypothetical protein IJV59_00485 [Eubacterium sp.]|jgi:NAD-dependent dihydropyrimidine dehydrogenase PreA subunit|nr:ferredoxin [Lachnospiraceae bacterium]MBQ7446414.1 hypothetical protein [Eubacterium sp.]MBQ9022528.1 hypothetical protein [Eubacterium sp.]
MEFVYEGQQFSVKHIVATERCSGCRRCIRACDEDVWRWDKELNCAIPKYIGECVHCYKCEMACLNNCIEIIPTAMIKNDPLLG